MTKYREASADVMAVMKRFSDFIERASIDEAYIDLTAAVDKRLKVVKRGEVTGIFTIIILSVFSSIS